MRNGKADNIQQFHVLIAALVFLKFQIHHVTAQYSFAFDCGRNTSCRFYESVAVCGHSVARTGLNEVTKVPAVLYTGPVLIQARVMLTVPYGWL